MLWTIVLLTVLATALIAMFRSDTRQLRNEADRLRAAQAAEAGINLAVAGLYGPPNMAWSADGVPHVLQFGGCDVEIKVIAESGKIDLNIGDRALIRGLLIINDVSSGAAEAIAKTILDRRGQAGFHDLNSPQTPSVDEGRPVAFETVGDLMTVPGITRELYDRLSPNLTVYSGLTNVDVSVASADVLRAIPGNVAADVEALLKQRTTPQFAPASGELSRIGQAYTIQAIARLPDGGAARKTKIIRLTGNPKKPALVLAVQQDR